MSEMPVLSRTLELFKFRKLYNQLVFALFDLSFFRNDVVRDRKGSLKTGRKIRSRMRIFRFFLGRSRNGHLPILNIDFDFVFTESFNGDFVVDKILIFTS